MILSAEKMLGTHEFARDLEAVKREAEEEASKAQMLADFWASADEARATSAGTSIFMRGTARGTSGTGLTSAGCA